MLNGSLRNKIFIDLFGPDLVKSYNLFCLCSDSRFITEPSQCAHIVKLMKCEDIRITNTPFLNTEVGEKKHVCVT